ncbi:hypothetical protein [Mesorhizobium sp. CA16]|uniref:hypothetical protein n=1 Tax=Mesorhizobium sp. CA16 TaxID=588496 RepID=UPI001CC912E2|nr:hypothetical protein [Mesorhizobium sp. CA16]MBZ9912786.1 hypothetical protein [Mesorhizobium sp. CA16]
MRNGLQLGELIGAAGEEALAKRGEGVGRDGRRSGVVEAVFKQKGVWGGMVGRAISFLKKAALRFVATK